jgi:hypothetical protein
MTSERPRMPTYRKMQEVAGTRTVRWSEALSRILVPLLRPVFRIPWLRERVDEMLPARLGAASSHLQRGDLASAFRLALTGAAESKAPRSIYKLVSVDSLLWWSFVHCAATAAAQLGDREREQVAGLVDAPPEPGGIREAECLEMRARWRWKAGDREGALELARRTVVADPTWPWGHVQLAWFGLVTGKLDPLPALREAVRLSRDTLASIRTDPEFSKHPPLIAALEGHEA